MSVLSGVIVTEATAAPPDVADHLQAYSIIPPGQDGSRLFGGHVHDQLGMYASLIDDDDVQDDELLDYFHSFQFGPGAVVEREYSPTAGVTIYRDDFGIPHVYGDTDELLAFGLGYATAEDRLWHMDILRHAAEGRLSEVLGPDLVNFDKNVRRTGYSKKEITSFYENADEDFANGALLQTMLRGYSDGVNARIAEVRADESLLPIEFTAQGVELIDWEPEDTIALAIFQLRDFGGGGGEETINAADLQAIQEKLGASEGKQVFDDLYYRNDPDAYTSIPDDEGAFPSPDPGPVDPHAVAIPDNAAKIAARTERSTRQVARGLRLSSPSSNFIAVAPEKSATGNSIEWGGPQVGYSVPQFFMEVDAHSPTFDLRGPALPGASFLVPLGRGIDYAWSLTTGASDLVDERVEKLCNPDGGKVKKKTPHYKFNGDCLDMTSRTEKIKVQDDDHAGGFRTQKLKVYRTVHGPVMGWGTVNGKPVAVSRQYAYWKKEIGFIDAIALVGSNQMDSVEEFSDALSTAEMSFNAIYADADGIGYFHVGRYPIRAEGTDPHLPSWGTGKWEWQGFLPWEQNPHVIHPAQGWIVNWNNKPSTGWDNSDHAGWGQTQRVGLTRDALSRLFQDGDQLATLSEVVNVARTVATQDARALELAPLLLAATTAGAGAETEALSGFSDWIDAGAHRRDRDSDDYQDFGTAVALADTWYEHLAHRVFDDDIGGLYGSLNIPFSDDPRENNGSSYFFDLSNHLEALLRGDTSGLFVTNFCDDRDTDLDETCEQQIQQAFVEAVAEISAAQGPDATTWTWPADYIEFDEVGQQSADPIPWQNRGTYNHAVEVTGSR
jgi:acyl-homoserine lactone acylase PvdQ